MCHIPVEPPCLHLVLDLLQQLVTFKVCFLTSSFYYLQESSLTETKGQLQRDVRPQWNNRLSSIKSKTANRRSDKQETHKAQHLYWITDMV